MELILIQRNIKIAYIMKCKVYHSDTHILLQLMPSANNECTESWELMTTTAHTNKICAHIQVINTS